MAADDSGTQRSEFIPPELWAEMIQPHYKRLCEWIHQHTGMKAFLHSCGSIHNLIPHFIEAGIDILNPVQISAANMEPERLKREFGGNDFFWGGGCDTQKVLATPAGGGARARESEMTYSVSAAATSSTRFTTSRPMSPPTTSSRCSKPPTSFGGY